MKVVLFGTPAFAVPTLAALLESRHDVVAVVSQPDKPSGRGRKITPGPVKARALAHGIPVLQPDRIRDPAFLAAFDDLDADLGVVAAYGKILPQALLDRPAKGMVNVHASLLPRWRGAAPVHRAILAGDMKTGVTIMRIVAALDAGPMIAREMLDIDPDETSASLEQRMATAGAHLLVGVVDALAEGPVREEPQDESLVTYAHRLERSDSQIDWARHARDVHNQIRGLHPWPLAAALLQARRVLLIQSRLESSEAAPLPPGTVIDATPDGLLVAARPGTLRIVRIQPEGRPPMQVRDFLNGRPVTRGDRFEPVPLPS